MARSVTPSEFFKWLKNHTHKTWFMGKEGGFMGKEGASPVMKYIHPIIDTRDMKIFHISFDNRKLDVDFRDSDSGKDDEDDTGESILDLINKKIEKNLVDDNSENMLLLDLKTNFPELDKNQVLMALRHVLNTSFDKLWQAKAKYDGDFKWNKKQYTYHELKEEALDIVNKAQGTTE